MILPGKVFLCARRGVVEGTCVDEEPRVEVVLAAEGAKVVRGGDLGPVAVKLDTLLGEQGARG